MALVDVTGLLIVPWKRAFDVSLYTYARVQEK